MNRHSLGDVVDFNWDSLAAGASGGLPFTVFLLWGFRSLNEKLDGFSTRLQRLELAFDMQSQDRLKSLADSIDKLFNRQEKLERDLTNLSSQGVRK